MTLGDRLAELRARSGMSQEDLAARLGVSRQSVSKWETGASVPDLDKLVKLSEVFSVSLDALAKGEDPQRPSAVRAAAGPVLRERLKKLYREKAYLLGWLLVFSGLLYWPRGIRVIVSYYQKTGWEDTVRFMDVMLYRYVFQALKIAAGLLAVFCGRRYSGRFRWHHLGWVPLAMGVFGIPECIRGLDFGPLETMLSALLLYGRFYGAGGVGTALSVWPELMDNCLLCGLGILILAAGGRNRPKSSPESFI